MKRVLTFLSMATEWDSAHGGLSTFNRELCGALATLGHRVYCGVPEFAPGELERARDARVHLVVPRQVIGITGVASLSHPFDLADIDVVIGHGRITGSHARAQIDFYYPKAKHVHFVHTNPRAIEPHKQREQEAMSRARDQLNVAITICKQADLVVGVGPELQKSYAMYLHPVKKPVHCFLPGLFADNPGAAPPPHPSCLLFGRAEDQELKGLPIAAKAMGEIGAMEDLRHARFVVLGVLPGDEDSLRASLSEIGGPKLPLDILPYTTARSDVLTSIRQAALVLMPSLEEGFGLSALEAISERVPVLISKKSGLALALEQYAPTLSAASIVDVRDGTEILTTRIRAALLENDAAFAQARMLRDAMVSDFNWEKSARELVDALDGLPSPPNTPPSRPPSTSPSVDASDALSGAFAKASSHVLGWQQTLRAGGKWLERPELERVLEYARDGGEGPMVLLGVPGSGKSALLARAAQTLLHEKTIVLAIKADRLPSSVNSPAALAEELGLPTDVESALLAASCVRNTVLIIDQMDALADLVDVETQRLDVLLDLVEKVSKNPTIRVVMSCREFDYEHDVRLRRLRANELKLQPPASAEIDAALNERGIDPAILAPRTRDLLNTMQALDVFLQVTPTRRAQPGMDSYQQLLGALWAERFSGRSDRAALEALAEQLAGLMADREELWLADAVIERSVTNSAAVQDLEKIGIVSRDGGRAAFSHQTLFEFARARHFLANETSLPAYVRARQNGLFVRPTLWTTLAYLRATDLQPYLQQLEDLWLDETLRPHLHRLLIDFVGQVDDPDPREALLLLAGLNEDRWRGVTVEAITGRAQWFELIKDVAVPTLMCGPAASMVSFLLTQAISFAPDSVADLIERHWLPVNALHPLIARVLSYAAAWPARFQTLATTLVKASQLEDSTLNTLIHSAIATSPSTASHILALELERRRAASLHDVDKADVETTRARYRELLDRIGRIDFIADVAAADHEGFVGLVWPWFVSVLRGVAHPSDDTTRYWEDYSLAASLESDFREFPHAMQEALAKCARTPSFIADFVRRWADETSMAVHRYIAVTLEAGLPEDLQRAIDYVTADRRRLNIGDISLRDGVSVRLVQALAPLLDDDQRDALEAAIHRSDSIPPSLYQIEARRHAYDANRLHRLRLLRALGERASASAKRLRSEEERRFPIDDEAFDPEMHEIVSPVSAEQMLRASDEDILHLFEELPDATERSHPERRMMGGNSQASQAFATAAKKAPNRFFGMLTKFKPGISEQPVLRALYALAEVEPLARIEDAIIELLALGFFQTSEQRSDVAWAIDKATRGSGTPKHPRPQIRAHIRTLLESWLGPGLPPAVSRPAATDESEKTERILGNWGLTSLPSGNYPILDTLTTAYLDLEEPDLDGWMNMLEAHVLRPEDPNVWLALSIQLHNVLFAPQSRAERFLSTLFARFPAMRDSGHGVTLISRAMARLPEATIVEWIADIESGTWKRKDQAVGELLAVLATKHNAGPELRVRLAHNVTHGSEARRRGLAYSAADLWHYPERRLAATEVLVGLIPDASPSLAEALMSTFRLESPLLDESTRRLLRTLSQFPNVILFDKTFGLIDSLRALLPSGADIVAPTALGLARFVATQPNQTYTFSQSSELIDIAMTLQRLGPRFRDQGLDLFELLLAQNAYGVRAVLADLDPVTRAGYVGPRHVPRAPRRGRRRRRLLS